jgi:hypothetical protein
MPKGAPIAALGAHLQSDESLGTANRHQRSKSPPTSTPREPGHAGQGYAPLPRSSLLSQRGGDLIKCLMVVCPPCPGSPG